MERFAHLAAKALNSVSELTSVTGTLLTTDLESPPDPKLGDFAFPCFKLAKALRLAPPQIAAKIAAAAAPHTAPELLVSSAGPYVNFTVKPEAALGALLKDILAGDGMGSYGMAKPDSRGTWVLEYSSPNVAKPLNFYHLRPTALGAAFDRIGRYRGFKVVSINHLGDWGKQYGMLAVAFKHLGRDPDADVSMMELVDLYVRINQEAEKNPALEEQAKEAFVKLEQGDAEVTKLWKKCLEISIREFDRIYKRLGVKFDHIWGESFYTPQLPGLIDTLKAKGLLELSEKAWIVQVTDDQGKEIPPCILLKSDGSTIYATRDVAAAIYRHEKFRFDRMTYIVGQEQKLHFQQVFGVLRRMGLEWVSKCEHIPFGLYRFKNSKMSTRKGNFVTLEDVLSEAKERVTELMQERTAKAAEGEDGNTGGTASRRETVAVTPEITEAVAIGACIFHDLASDPARDVDFDLERVVDFEGETGPYLQYAHTRCQSILRKARDTGELKGEVVFSDAAVAALKEPQEIALVKKLGQFPLQLERTLTFSKASHLCSYLIDVTKAFGLFYRECRVLGEAPETTRARLMLVDATRRVLGQGLSLLGIPLPERM